MDKKKAYALQALLVLAALIAGTWLLSLFAGSFKNNTDVIFYNATPLVSVVGVTPTPRKVDYIFNDVMKLLTEFETAREASIEQYTAKCVCVTGTIRSIGTDNMGDTYVCLNDGNVNSWVYAQCYIENAYDFKVGDKLTLTGIVSDYMIVLSMIECVEG